MPRCHGAARGAIPTARQAAGRRCAVARCGGGTWRGRRRRTCHRGRPVRRSATFEPVNRRARAPGRARVACAGSRVPRPIW